MDVVNALLGKGADVEAKDKVSGGRVVIDEICRVLIEEGRKRGGLEQRKMEDEGRQAGGGVYWSLHL